MSGAVGLTPAKNPRGWLKLIPIADERWKAKCRACRRNGIKTFQSKAEALAWWYEQHCKDKIHQRLISVEHIRALRERGVSPEARLLHEIFGGTPPPPAAYARGVRLGVDRTAEGDQGGDDSP